MQNYDYDLIVIGSGPAGEGAAIKAAKSGLKVAIVDAKGKIGGNCTHQATIPSKALRHAVQHFSINNKYRDYTYPQMLETAKNVISQQENLRTDFYQRNEVDTLYGHAKFLDINTISIIDQNQIKEKFTAKNFIITTGSRPYRPKSLDFNHPRILDADKVLNLKEGPKSLVIYGAGVIGCEYASIFRELKVRVTLINTRSQLLSFLDDEIIDGLSYHLRENGIRIIHSESLKSVETTDDQVIIELNSNKKIKAEYMLFAQGRSGNSDNMGLDTIGMDIDSRGYIQTNKNLQSTMHSHIYAAGDIVGYPSLASAAFDQGRYAATHMIQGKCDSLLVKDIPTGIYTLPEISSVGKTEKELTAEKVPYETGHAFFKDTARAQITGHTVGMLKLLFHRETLQLLGIHCFGYQASEIIHIGQAIYSQEGQANSIKYFANTTFNYPTMAEAYRVAALNGLNRL